MVIAPKNFRDSEYFVTKNVLEAAEHEVLTASKTAGEAVGFEGQIANVEYRLSQIEVEPYQAVVFIGGEGMNELVNDEEMVREAKKFYELGKVTAAICVASAILANAEILRGKKATSWAGVKDLLTQKGALYVDQEVVQDGKVITAIGPGAAKAFGEKIVEVLKSSSEV